MITSQWSDLAKAVTDFGKALVSQEDIHDHSRHLKSVFNPVSNLTTEQGTHEYPRTSR